MVWHGLAMSYGRVSSEDTAEEPSPGVRRLAAAILAQAVKDAAETRPWPAWHGPGSPSEAREWLQSPEARLLAAALDLDDSLERWLATGAVDHRKRKRDG